MTEGIRVLHFMIPGQPVPKARPRIVFRRGRAHAMTPKRTAEAEATIRSAVAIQGGAMHHDGPVALLAQFYRHGHRPADLDNLLKLPLDALNGLLWLDDSQVLVLLAEKHDGQAHPRTCLMVALGAPGTTAASLLRALPARSIAQRSQKDDD